jgi:hypothetical protein
MHENKTTTLLSGTYIFENFNYFFYADYDPLHPTDDETADQLSDAEAMRLLEEENDPAETAPPAAPAANSTAPATPDPDPSTQRSTSCPPELLWTLLTHLLSPPPKPPPLRPVMRPPVALPYSRTHSPRARDPDRTRGMDPDRGNPDPDTLASQESPIPVVNLIIRQLLVTVIEMSFPLCTTQ